MPVNIHEVGGVPIKQKHKASCHCGSVEIEPGNLSGIRIVRGEEVLKLYQFKTRTAKHYFSSACGIHTHHQRRSHPDQYGFNVACLEGINPLTLENIPIRDGINHPADRAEKL